MQPSPLPALTPPTPKTPPPDQPPLTSMLATSRWRKDKPWWCFVLLALWFPFGIVLCAVRFVIMFLVFLFFNIGRLFRCEMLVLNFFYPMMGFIVVTDRKRLRAANRPRILVCNHMSDFDGYALWTVVPPNELTFITTIYMQSLAQCARRCGVPLSVIVRAPSDNPEKRLQVRESIKEELHKGRRVLFVNAEGAETNGRVGLLRYNKFTFGLGMDIQPLALKRAEENETDSQFADRVQTMTAHNLGLYPTTYTFMDKVNAFKLKR
ncbi:hypothetical protein PAPYR_1783 [Paratrimastix pyriformis]|uniref:Phospholipid/glycerol acyltransferase domain-containing protein n=1 Tax=Paratrimastix pyriformis TaxID=342808 RepID=A0ABQ8US52_9EUKA|nr:hypothetical protein PAPYR_1783 [Paratrimastix pyriformis]